MDDASRRLVRVPQSMDVVLCMNLYGDILSDLSAEVAGGLGTAPSGCFGDKWAYFESVHGSAPDHDEGILQSHGGGTHMTRYPRRNVLGAEFA
jgi:isocitrate/isopropylmalate dehydrogenase